MRSPDSVFEILPDRRTARPGGHAKKTDPEAKARFRVTWFRCHDCGERFPVRVWKLNPVTFGRCARCAAKLWGSS